MLSIDVVVSVFVQLERLINGDEPCRRRSSSTKKHIYWLPLRANSFLIMASILFSMES
jgi:hypothetical protein